MTQVTTIAVVALMFLLIGVMMCAFAGFCWFMIVTMKRLQGSVDSLAKVSNEWMGDGAIHRIGKSLATLSANFPEMLEGLKAFNKTMSIFNRNAFRSDTAAPSTVSEESGFYGYSEATAADVEQRTEAERQKLPLTEEQLASMRTDTKPTPAPAGTTNES